MWTEKKISMLYNNENHYVCTTGHREWNNKVIQRLAEFQLNLAQCTTICGGVAVVVLSSSHSLSSHFIHLVFVPSVYFVVGSLESFRTLDVNVFARLDIRFVWMCVCCFLFFHFRFSSHANTHANTHTHTPTRHTCDSFHIYRFCFVQVSLCRVRTLERTYTLVYQPCMPTVLCSLAVTLRMYA